MIRFNRRRRVRGQTMVWQQSDTGWERCLIRKLDDGTIYASELVRVQPDRPVCLVCLGHEVLLCRSALYEYGELFCQDCGARYGIV